MENKKCEDCISREVVKDMLTAEWTKYMPMELDINLSFVLDKISALPSVTTSYNSVKTELRSSDDCISREDVMRILKTLYNFDDLKDLKVKQQEVMNLPSVTPTRPHGEWIYVQYDGNKNIGNWHCSNCRQICIAMHSMDDAFDFCPNCGADMREVQDEDSD